MKLIQAAKLDRVADYKLIDAPTPAPREGLVLIKVMACGMGYVDALVALGRYQVKPPVPFTPGQEIGGIVEAIGAGVANVKPGDRVLASSFGGGLAEYSLAPAAAVVPIPQNMSFAQAAAFRVNYVTALHGLADRAPLRAGERLLVFGAAGGVGAAAVQIGKILGAEVIAAASTEEKRAFALAQGASAAIDTNPEGWRDRLKQICGGKGPDVIFDPVTGPLFEPAFRSLVWNGRHLVIGFAGGPIPALPINLTLMKGAALVGVDVRQFFLFEAPRAETHLAQLLAWVGEGKLTPPIGKVFLFEDFAEAMTFATSGQGVGKTIIEIARG